MQTRDLFAISGTGVSLNDRFSRFKAPNQMVKAIFDLRTEKGYAGHMNFAGTDWSPLSSDTPHMTPKASVLSRLGRISVKNRLTINPSHVNQTNIIKRTGMITRKNIIAKSTIRRPLGINRPNMNKRNIKSLKLRGSNVSAPLKKLIFKKKALNKQTNLKNRQQQLMRKGKRNIANPMRITRNINPQKKEKFRTNLDSELDNYMAVSKGKLDKDLDYYMAQTNDNIKKTHYI